MKGIICIIICVLITAFALGQSPKSVEGKELKEMTTTPPVFTGIKAPANLSNSPAVNLQRYLMSNIEYPARSISDGAEGTEVVQFTVTSEGKVTDFKVLNGVSHEIDNEIIWAIQQTEGMWDPGKSNDIPADMVQEVSIAFSSNSNGENNGKHFANHAKDYFAKGNNAIFVDGNAKKAARYYSMGIRYLPHDPCLLYMRGICRYETGNKEGAKEDWQSGSFHGGIDMSELTQLQNLKGYNEMLTYIPK